MVDVNVSAADLRKLSSALRNYQTEVKDASRKVEGALRSANWHDSQKQKFETRLKDFQRQVDRFMTGEVEAMAKSLGELARKVDDIRNTRM